MPSYAERHNLSLRRPDGQPGPRRLRKNDSSGSTGEARLPRQTAPLILVLDGYEDGESFAPGNLTAEQVIGLLCGDSELTNRTGADLTFTTAPKERGWHYVYLMSQWNGERASCWLIHERELHIPFLCEYVLVCNALSPSGLGF